MTQETKGGYAKESEIARNNAKIQRDCAAKALRTAEHEQSRAIDAEKRAVQYDRVAEVLEAAGL